MLKLYLLGPPRVELEEVPVQIQRRKALALLVYLAVTGRPHGRDALATLFYPELDQSRARAYFRRDLGALNNQLAGDWLKADRETVGLGQPTEVWTDVAAFRRELVACGEHGHAVDDVCADCRPLLTRATELYADHFLAGFSLPDCPEFDEWQFFEAENLRQELAAALERLVKAHADQEEYEQALPFARRWLKLDPLHEPAHRELMKLYALSGQQAAALRQYENCVALLDEELGVAPEEETTRVYEAIKARRLDQLTDQADVASPAQMDRRMSLSEISTARLPSFLAEDDPPEEPPAPIFVVRERELSLLATVLKSTKANHGQLRFIIGGAGQGKTALVQEFARRAQNEDPDLVVIRGNCNAITGIGDPYLPFREALIMLTGDVEAKCACGLISRRHARQLWELLPVVLPALVKHAPGLINSLVPGQALYERAAAVATGDGVWDDGAWFKTLTTFAAGGQEADLDQKRIFAQYTALLKAVAAQRPLLLIIEDLHWVDAASSGLLFHLSREIGESRIMVAGTYRPEEIVLGHAPGQGDQHPLATIVGELKRQQGDIWLDLDDLATIEGRDFVDAYLDTQPNVLGEAFKEALFQRTEGHALFTVELLQAMQERGDLQQDDQGRWFENAAIDWAKMPVKVEGAIERVIERLTEELQTILTVASVEGEVFTAEVVAQIQQLEQRTLVQQLSRDLDKRYRLVTAQSLDRLDSGQRLSSYRFRHQLFQLFLYNRLDDVERGYLHEAVGNALEQLYAGQTERVASQLAYHFEAAGLADKAIHYLRKAGDAAAAVHANIEAAAYYKRAVTLAEEKVMKAEELAHLYVSLGGQLMVTKGDSAPEVGQAYGRALELCGPAGESSQRFAALRGSAMYHKFRGELETARKLSEEMLSLANSLQDPVLIVEAFFALGSLYFYFGDLVQAQGYLEQGFKSYDKRQHQSLILLYGQDPGVANLCYESAALWLLGYPNRALKRSNEALTLARELDHPYSLAMAYNWDGWVQTYRREKQAVLERTDAMIRLSTKYNFAIFLGVGKLLRGWVLAGQGDPEQGISQIRQGLSTISLATGSEDERVEFVALLAESYGRAEQPGPGLSVLSKALAFVKESQYLHWGQPELYRLKGELLLLHEGHAASDEAETCFRQAIDVAKQQGAKSFELRAVMSLCRLWRAQGKQEEAQQMLAAIYEWFSEGFTTPDLQEAKALLDELA